MPAGLRHNKNLGNMWSKLDPIADERGWLLYMDNFMLYRNEENKRDRVAPDLLIVPYRDDEMATTSYDIESQSLPYCAIEIVSPSSKEKDEKIHTFYLEYLHIPTCVIIQLVDEDGWYLPNPSIAVWHRDAKTGRAIAATPDDDGKYYLPELQLWIGLKNTTIYFVDEVTGETLADVGTERFRRQAAEKRMEQERQKRLVERREREAAEDENARLLALLKQHGIEP